jgi:hypothetical protein
MCVVCHASHYPLHVMRYIEGPPKQMQYPRPTHPPADLLSSCANREARGGNFTPPSPPWVQVQWAAGMGWRWSRGSNLVTGPLGSVAGEPTGGTSASSFLLCRSLALDIWRPILRATGGVGFCPLDRGSAPSLWGRRQSGIDAARGWPSEVASCGRSDLKVPHRSDLKGGWSGYEMFSPLHATRRAWWCLFHSTKRLSICTALDVVYEPYNQKIPIEQNPRVLLLPVCLRGCFPVPADRLVN